MVSTPSCTLEERIQVNYLILYDRLKGKMQIYKQMPPINIDHLFNHPFTHRAIRPPVHSRRIFRGWQPDTTHLSRNKEDNSVCTLTPVNLNSNLGDNIKITDVKV